MGKRSVTVHGGGANLYKIEEYGGRFHAYHVRVGIFSNTNVDIGKTKTLEDALALIRSHSGKEIKSID